MFGITSVLKVLPSIYKAVGEVVPHDFLGSHLEKIQEVILTEPIKKSINIVIERLFKKGIDPEKDEEEKIYSEICEERDKDPDFKAVLEDLVKKVEKSRLSNTSQTNNVGRDQINASIHDGNFSNNKGFINLGSYRGPK